MTDRAQSASNFRYLDDRLDQHKAQLEETEQLIEQLRKQVIELTVRVERLEERSKADGST